MHLLATTSGVIDGAAEAVDLKQSPADIVVLTAADSEIAALARAYDTGKFPTLRLANFLHLQHNLSVDLYLEKTLSIARLIVLRLLGGASYWPYGLDQIEALAKANDIKLVVLPGDAQPDMELTSRSNLPHRIASACADIWWQAANPMLPNSWPIAPTCLMAAKYQSPPRRCHPPAFTAKPTKGIKPGSSFTALLSKGHRLPLSML